MRGALMAGFFASASVGSVLGVMLGGLIAARWGWKAAFGVVGFPGLLLALLYLKVRDYPTVELTSRQDRAMRSTRSAAQAIVKALVRSRTMLWVCVGGAAQVLVVSAIWSWLPSFLNREYGLPPDQAAVKAALVVLCGAIGSVVWVRSSTVPAPPPARQAVRDGAAVHRLVPGGGCRLRRSAARPGDVRAGPLRAHRPRWLPDDLHRRPGDGDRDRRDPPAVRATSASVLALFLNLFGLAAGSFIAGVLSDAWGLTTALTAIPAFSLLAALAFRFAARTYEADIQRAGQPTDEPASTP